MHSNKILRIITLLVLILSLALSGCGRKPIVLEMSPHANKETVREVKDCITEVNAQLVAEGQKGVILQEPATKPQEEPLSKDAQQKLTGLVYVVGWGGLILMPVVMLPTLVTIRMIDSSDEKRFKQMSEIDHEQMEVENKILQCLAEKRAMKFANRRW